MAGPPTTAMKFELYVRRWGPTCITVRNLIKIGQTVAEIWQNNGYQNGGRPPLGFVKFKFFNGRSG